MHILIFFFLFLYVFFYRMIMGLVGVVRVVVVVGVGEEEEEEEEEEEVGVVRVVVVLTSWKKIFLLQLLRGPQRGRACVEKTEKTGSMNSSRNGVSTLGRYIFWPRGWLSFFSPLSNQETKCTSPTTSSRPCTVPLYGWQRPQRSNLI